MRIGIIGAGALGTLFGYRLAAANVVTMLEVRADIVAAVGRDGLRIADDAPRAVTITSNARALLASQVLFVFVRATDTMRALRPFVAELDPSTVIVSLQNGVSNEDAIKATLGGAIALVVGATTESALTVGPGHAVPVGGGTTILGPGGASPDVCSRIARLLADAARRRDATADRLCAAGLVSAHEVAGTAPAPARGAARGWRLRAAAADAGTQRTACGQRGIAHRDLRQPASHGPGRRSPSLGPSGCSQP